MGLGAGGKIDAVFLVGSKTSADLEFFVKNGWKAAEVYDKDLNDLQFNGQALYEGLDVKVEGVGSVYTYQVKTFIFGKELGEQQQELFESVMATR